ncbi:putative tricarboxylic transport membrane protein [Saccharopolyspora kobensis]|uniref:Tricarboxylic transport membrane protein n=2 Tax=Saccharopolyspora kobensis TaxID=146035 RepID=A0A1H5WGV7_9PSEU|nr:tripartite tricarboxylate transporter substrate binding protein [Saccharopolyspora kobensis]SEF98593.1 putative tricarboxylic transport membrane protein [Saccharopolyspora kobensis]SFD75529.1 putative tricarboxylic transport membrane protein [Saccharopolyspora kobensis]
MRALSCGRRVLAALSTVVLLGSCALGESGQEQAGAPRPVGPVTMVVPFAAGGGSDISGRAVADGLAAAIPGLRVDVDNREGGQGAVGYSYLLSKAGSPNYLLATETSLLSLPLSVEVAFSHRSFTPVMKLGEDYTLLVALPGSPITSCADAVAQSRHRRVLAGISGAVGPDAVVFSELQRRSGADFDTVPYEGGGETMAAVLGGQVELASLNPSEVMGQLRAGELKALCVFAEQRYDYPQLAHVPTSLEQGIPVSFAQFRGVIAPGGLSPQATAYWIEAARSFAGSAAYRDYIASEFLQPRVAFGEEFAAYLAEAETTLAQVVRR